MWSTVALPLAMGGITATTPTPRRHLVGVGRNKRGIGEGGDAAHIQLRGSDVLMALHRASATKYKEDKSGTRNEKYNDSAAIRVRGNSSVNPICINPQWAHQLHHLETTLNQLLHTS